MNLRDARMAQAADLSRAGRHDEADAVLAAVLAADPTDADAWYQAGWTRKQAGRFQPALDAYARAIELGVAHPEEAHLDRYVILTDHLRRDACAERELDAALRIAPDYLPALLNLGNLREEQGRREDALAVYDRARAVAVPAGHPHADLRHEALARSVQLRPPASPDDPIFGQIEAATRTVGDRQPEIRANLLFAAGKAQLRLGQDAAAFEAFARANRHLLRTHGRLYRRADSERLFDAIIAAFPRADAPTAADPSPARPGPQPVFICGLWRSGSTLLEQALAALPNVHAAGEVDYLLRLASRGELAPYPGSMARLRDLDADRLGADYLAHLRSLVPQAGPDDRITDKRPDNFLLIGMIKRLLPGARILHARRHPMDVGMSIYMQHLNPLSVPYSTDLRDIGHYIGQHRRLMAHWQALYPYDILEVDYDRLVREPELSLRAVLDFIGLPWDDTCLRFHELDNTVKTASYWQVRQPLYASASGRWRRHAAALEPLRQSLLEAGIEVDAAEG